MSLRQDVYIIIPVFNEAATLRNVLVDLESQGFSNVIVVDDGSTEDIFYGISDLPVYYLRHRANLGQGAALQTGFEYAKEFDPSIVVTFDADGQHDVKDLPAMLLPLETGQADVSLGSRFLTISNNEMPAGRKWMLKMARMINFLFTGLLLSDAHNGLRALNSKALHCITLSENRMAHASEFILQIKKHKLKFVEIPVNIRYTAYSKKKGQHSSESIKILFDLVLHKFFK
jgi:glycosyltransferase involved in cell wall biosynthesis